MTNKIRQYLCIDSDITYSSDVRIDERHGPVFIGKGTIICPGVCIQGPVVIGADCVIGNNSFIRAGTCIGNRVKIGYSVEIKNSVLAEDVSVGPLCFIADSIILMGAYLGALVRTSNHRLDKRTVRVNFGGELIDTGRDKLGCFIGERASLGVQVITLPGRYIQADTLIGPGIIVERNMPTGKYILQQQIIKINEV